ncbi:hypothetical protein SAY86_016081 [Trapa natans]|uniref:DUF2062 domain-containing protein n=1 Tax=Trapa natans TaxID=22666 RepID=A0AAN7LD25_TRANT|nr:hypothetical protein SAY86_016081 [Trapa natans]
MATPRAGTTNWFHKKIVDPLIQILHRGAEPRQLAFSSALGITLGVFPICGVTVFLCGMAIALLGNLCHSPSVMLFNFIATPIELSLIVPFLRFGEAISGGPHFPLTSDALKRVLTGQASREVLLSILHAIIGWAVAAPFIVATLYMIFLPCFKLLISKFSTQPPSPKVRDGNIFEGSIKGQLPDSAKGTAADFQKGGEGSRRFSGGKVKAPPAYSAREVTNPTPVSLLPGPFLVSPTAPTSHQAPVVISAAAIPSSSTGHIWAFQQSAATPGPPTSPALIPPSSWPPSNIPEAAESPSYLQRSGCSRSGDHFRNSHIQRSP